MNNTNAQENVGKQFQEQALKAKMKVGECVYFAWKFCNLFKIEHVGIASGMQAHYGHFSSLIKKQKKRQSAINDGRAPDKTEDLIEAKAKRRRKTTTTDEFSSSSMVMALPKPFPGIKWSIDLPHVHVTNTCPLDSLLTLIYTLHKCNIFTNDWPQLSNEQSLLSRSFALLDNNQCDDARLLWVKEFYGHNDIPPSGSCEKRNRKKIDIFGTCSVFFDGGMTTHPIRDAVRLEFKQESTCIREGGCAVPDRSKTGQVRHQKIGYFRAMSTNDDPFDLIKGMMEEHTTTGTCIFDWETKLEEMSDDNDCAIFDPSEDVQYCPGPVLNSDPTDIS